MPRLEDHACRKCGARVGMARKIKIGSFEAWSCLGCANRAREFFMDSRLYVVVE